MGASHHPLCYIEQSVCAWVFILASGLGTRKACPRADRRLLNPGKLKYANSIRIELRQDICPW